MGLYGYIFAFGVVCLGCGAWYKAWRQGLAVDCAVENFKRTFCLFVEWKKARPFLWVGQSSYARLLVLDMMDDIRVLAKYARSFDRVYAEKCDKALLALEKMLQQDPPPYNPPNSSKLLRELASFPHSRFSVSVR